MVSLGTATALGAIILAGAAGGFAGGFSGVILNGGNLGQALVAGVIGGAIGAATAFLSCAAGGVEAGISKTGAIFERAAKHAFADMWMGGVKSAVSGGEWSPIRDMIGGALSSAGNGLINENMHDRVLKVASSAALGGTISEIGGGKFANGAITGAYTMLYNELQHPANDDRLTGRYEAHNFDDGSKGAEIDINFTDPRINKDTKVYQIVQMKGEYGWDDGDLHQNPVTYPFAHYEGNNTINFYDLPSSAVPYRNGDYFKATIYIMSPNGSVAKIDWGWHISNNQVYLKPLKIR